MDPQQQQALNQFAGLGAGILGAALLIGLAVVAFIIYMIWRVFTKAGMSGALSLLVLVPFGVIIVLCILAFGKWNVVPVSSQLGNTYPPYPPNPLPPTYPTAQFPTSTSGADLQTGSVVPSSSTFPPSSGLNR